MADGNSKKQRHNSTSRPRGSQIKTHNSGGPRTKLTSLEKLLMGKGIYQSLSHKRDEENRKYRASRQNKSRSKRAS